MKFHTFVLHNISRDMFFGYKPESSRLFHAHTFQVVADNADQAVELIWILTNVDSPDMLRQEHPHLAQYADDVAEYRRRRNRSLSVGDVVVLYNGEQPLVAKACESLGWKDYDPSIIDVEAMEVDNRQPISQSWHAYQGFMEEQNAR